MSMYGFGLSAGYNVATPTNIETITPTNGTRFYPPSVTPFYSRGVIKLQLDSLDYASGFAWVPWLFNRMTNVQWYYLFNTINSGRYRGPVTINTLTNNFTTKTGSYSRLNAIMYLPEPQQRNFQVLPNYTVFMTHLATPS